MTSDLYAAKSAVSGNIINFFRNIIVCLSNIIVLLMLSWKLTFFVLATIPPFLLITAVYSRLLKLHEKYLT
jgi:ABC-type bacteriocin/lantibiotic exporter with double-glycine peptidase domain